MNFNIEFTVFDLDFEANVDFEDGQMPTFQSLLTWGIDAMFLLQSSLESEIREAAAEVAQEHWDEAQEEQAES